LGNFRGLGTPERRVIFAISDLDETLPAPWEWDLKRLAASFVVACRNNGLSYLGKSDAFDKAIEAFSVAYADQNERDYESVKKAAQAGKLEVLIEEE
jgi:uncharacterized protein (DUF2252 family)